MYCYIAQKPEARAAARQAALTAGKEKKKAAEAKKAQGKVIAISSCVHINRYLNTMLGLFSSLLERRQPNPRWRKAK